VLLFQLAVKADEHHGNEEGRRQVGRNIGIVLAILAPACAGLWLVVPSFEVLVVPAEFRGAFARNLALLMPGLFCYGLVFFALSPVFQIEKRTAPLVAVALGASLVNLGVLAALRRSEDSFPVAQGVALLIAALALVAWAQIFAPFWPRLRDLVGVFGGTAAVITTAWSLGRVFSPGAPLMALQILASVGVYAAIVGAFDLCGLRTLAARAWREKRVRVA
jgi:hypothetical protein